MRKNIFGAIENFFGQARETGDLYSVTFVSAARDDFAEKNDLLVPFTHSDVKIADAFTILGEFRQLMVMRGEQTARFDLVVEELGHAPRDRESVKSGSATANLVK